MSPAVPPIPGIEETGYLTSDTVWALRELPRRLLVLGGGPIGCELTQAFARLGSGLGNTVTLMEMLPRLMVKEDVEVSAMVQKKFEAEGVTVLTGHKAKAVVQEGGEKFLVVERDGKESRIPFDEIL